MATLAAHPSDAGPIDARVVASLYGQALHYICELCHEGISTALGISLSYLSDNLAATTPAAIEQRLQDISTNVNSGVPMILLRVLDILTLSIMGEQFISGYGTNAIAYINPYITDQVLIAGTKYEMLDSSICSCLQVLSLSCKLPAAIYFDAINPVGNNYSINRNKTLIKGMKTDCFPFNGFFASTLECYYDLSCIKLLVSNTSSFSPLNPSLPSKFALQSTLKELTNSLMVEEFNLYHSTENLYEQCVPLTCSYSYIHRSTVLAIIISAVGFVSGVNTILRLISPIIIDVVLKLKAKIMGSGTRQPKVPAPGNYDVC